MTSTQFQDMKALVLGSGIALVLYYGLAISLVLGGAAELNRPVTWLGLLAGAAAVLVALPTGKKRTRA